MVIPLVPSSFFITSYVILSYHSTLPFLCMLSSLFGEQEQYSVPETSPSPVLSSGTLPAEPGVSSLTVAVFARHLSESSLVFECELVHLMTFYLALYNQDVTWYGARPRCRRLCVR